MAWCAPRIEAARVTRGPFVLGWRAKLASLLLPLLLPAGVFFGVLATAPLGAHSAHADHPDHKTTRRLAIPDEPYDAHECNWCCHNHGCRHAPLLPPILTADRGLFGQTIRGLFLVGRLVSRDRATGYGVVNLALFCAIWPGAMYVLAVTAIRQRIVLRRVRHERTRPNSGRQQT